MLHEPDEWEWETVIRRVYREEVAAASTVDESASRADAMVRAAERVQRMIDDGDVKPNASEVIASALRKADDGDARAADAVIDRLARGEGALEMDDDPLLDVVVKLGAGRRKPWRFVIERDLFDMDRLRYQNMRAQQDAYDRWRQGYDAVLPMVRRFGSVGVAVDGGAWAVVE